VTFFYFRKKGTTTSGSSGYIQPSPYEGFLDVMETVFRGGSKKQQDDFIKLNADKIREYKLFYDFEKKYNKMVEDFGK